MTDQEPNQGATVRYASANASSRRMTNLIFKRKNLSKNPNKNDAFTFGKPLIWTAVTPC